MGFHKHLIMPSKGYGVKDSYTFYLPFNEGETELLEWQRVKCTVCVNIVHQLP